MTSQTRSWIKRMEAERLSGCCGDDLPDVQAHAQAEQLQFIDKRDIHASVNVFEKLGHLRGSRRGNRHSATEDGSIESGCEFGRLAVQASDDFGNIMTRHAGVAGIFPLGRKRNVELLPARISVSRCLEVRLVSLLENWNQYFLSSPGIGCALENNQLAGSYVRRNGLCSVGDETEVRLVILVQRSRDADDDCVHLCDPRILRGRRKPIGFGSLHFFRGNAKNVGPTL